MTDDQAAAEDDELEELIQADARTGLMFRLDRGQTAGIVWRRGGDLNPLAEEIIARVVDAPFSLELAGHRYEIRRV